MVEKQANKHNISLRVGCFCNPGLHSHIRIHIHIHIHIHIRIHILKLPHTFSCPITHNFFLSLSHTHTGISETALRIPPSSLLTCCIRNSVHPGVKSERKYFFVFLNTNSLSHLISMNQMLTYPYLLIDLLPHHSHFHSFSLLSLSLSLSVSWDTHWVDCDLLRAEVPYRARSCVSGDVDSVCGLL